MHYKYNTERKSRSYSTDWCPHLSWLGSLSWRHVLLLLWEERPSRLGVSSPSAPGVLSQYHHAPPCQVPAHRDKCYHGELQWMGGRQDKYFCSLGYSKINIYTCFASSRKEIQRLSLFGQVFYLLQWSTWRLAKRIIQQSTWTLPPKRTAQTCPYKNI